MVSSGTKLTLQEFLALPEKDVMYSLLPGLELTPRLVFAEAELI